jgi:hypothetical protein
MPALTAMQIQFETVVMEEHQRTAIGLMYTIRARKVGSKQLQSPSCCFYFQRGKKQNSKRNGLPMTESH